MNYSNKSINFYLKKYKLKDPWDLVDLFEKNVAHYTGSKYGIAVDCCTNAIFLSLKYLNSKKKLLIPKNTYISILSAITLANYNFRFVKKEWSGSYQIEPLPIYDSATKFTNCHSTRPVCASWTVGFVVTARSTINAIQAI